MIKRLTRGAILAAINGRYYGQVKAPIKPFEIYNIDPNNINKATINKPKIRFPIVSKIDSGCWDKNTRPVKNDVVYKSMVSRYEKNQEWEDTKYHGFMKKKIKDTSLEWRGYKKESDIYNRFNYLDNLYETIRNDGYSEQKELHSTKESVGRYSLKLNFESLLPPELNEISVDISRDGELYWATGMHRLCIAKILDLEQIPVRIRVRHSKWQEQRDQIYKEKTKLCDHPDLQFE